MEHPPKTTDHKLTLDERIARALADFPSPQLRPRPSKETQEQNEREELKNPIAQQREDKGRSSQTLRWAPRPEPEPQRAGVRERLPHSFAFPSNGPGCVFRCSQLSFLHVSFNNNPDNRAGCLFGCLRVSW